ncbi:MAG: hypothetical protein ACI4LA_06205 [Emergencia sp.]
MMEDIRRIIELERMLQEKQLRLFERELKRLPEGKLVLKGKYYYKRKTRDGKTEEKYIPIDQKRHIEQLKTRAFLEKGCSLIKSNRAAMDRFLRDYQNFDPLAIGSRLGKAYRILPEDCYRICGIQSQENWEKRRFRTNPFRTESLTMKTIKGSRVRSKSELVIANQLYLSGIPYRYEPELCLGDKTVYPDFEILRTADHRTFYWEHQGMTSDETYMDRADEKIRLYREHGIIPWKNLILTYDDENGTLDSEIIARIIDVFLKR